MSKRKWITLLAALTLVAPLMFYGCSGETTEPRGDRGDRRYRASGTPGSGCPCPSQSRVLCNMS